MTMTLRSASVKTDPASILLQGGKLKASFEARPSKAKGIYAEYTLKSPYAFQHPKTNKLVATLTFGFNSKGNKFATYVKDLVILRFPDKGTGKERAAFLSISVWEHKDPDGKGDGGCEISILDMGEHRENLGFESMAALARKAGLHPDTVSKAEKGESVSLETINKLSKHLT